MGIPKIIFSPESHHPPHPCISDEIRHHPSAQPGVLFVVVSSFSRVVAISPSTPCLLLDKFTAPEFRKIARELSDLFFPSLSRSCARLARRRLCSAVARQLSLAAIRRWIEIQRIRSTRTKLDLSRPWPFAKEPLSL